MLSIPRTGEFLPAKAMPKQTSLVFVYRARVIAQAALINDAVVTVSGRLLRSSMMLV